LKTTPGRWRFYLHYGQWLAFVGAALLAALFWAWQLLAQVNFLYPLWYEILEIDQTIATYGPRNRYRKQFETTTKAERVRLFAAIAHAIRHQGEGLEELLYHDPTGRPVDYLLRPAEITHLRDVARLVDVIAQVGWGATLVALVLLVGLYRQRLSMPAVGGLLLGVAGMVGTLGGVVLLLGPVRVFYTLHTWIFPPGHPWFFYYEDSLMTLLMQAPNIFGWIALALVGSGLVFFTGLLLAVSILYRRAVSASG